LTLQRLSHLSNEQRTLPADRKRDWQRPLWLVGLAIFLVSNVTGTLFQISTLPLVVLGPLGAVSLVCNALFAHLLLGDAFSVQLAVGSALIAAGATLVGIFGAVPEQSHTLPQLVALYQRPAFLAWLALLAGALALVLTASHLAEWRLARTLSSLPAAPKSPRFSANRPADRTRLWLAIAYGAASGTLSGLCLLFTKTGMDLVIQTLVHRNNQFGHFGAWALLIVLLVCELAQLSYLNRALRLVGPTLVCPTAFCFYNAASILSGLIYYRQFDALRPVQGFLIALGSVVLLGGVWIVSVKPATLPAEAE
ncbi:hypothetical protein RHOSPDRAFT_9622, partial [Rhodotorula sp. JG-1b]